MSSSRLIVKNLPKNVTAEKLKETFSCRGGQVTDVQLKYTKDRVFRHFAFVGFREESEAEEAKKHLNGSFIGACKVDVQVCADLGSKDKPRAWSKYSADSSNNREVQADDDVAEPSKKKEKKKKKQQKVDALLEKYKDDPKFQEFLRVHKRNASGGLWNNDAILEVSRSYKKEEENNSSDKAESDEEGVEGKSVEEEEDSDNEDDDKELVKDAAVSDLDYLKSKTIGAEKPVKEKKIREPKNVEYYTVKVEGLPFKAKKKDLKLFFKGLNAKSIRVPQKIRGIAFVGFADEKDGKKALNKNKSFIDGHQILVKHYEKVTTAADSAAKDDQPKWKEQEESLKNEETVAESGRLFVRNLSYTVTEADIDELFKKYGPLTEVNVPIDRETRKVKGFAFVTYMVPENAVKAFSELDGTSFQGRLLHLIPGKAKESPEELANAEGLNFKQKKALKEKAQAGSSHNWNTLFLGASAVADIMAEKYNVSKSDVLTSSAGKQSAAVRLALGETQIVAETRQFLEEQGISVDAFNQTPTVRSKTTILIKNLPAKTPIEEIRDLFAKHGELGRVVLPPNGITAIVEFFEPTEARQAFRALAYTKFRSSMLYLEWAPENSFTSAAPSREQLLKQQTAAAGKKGDEDDTSAPPEENSTLFVKNLNFLSTEEALKEHFSQVGTVHSVTISKKKDMKRPLGEMLSMGYGFVQFKTAGAADKALKTMQHKMLDQHCLELKRSTRASTAKEEEIRAGRKKSTGSSVPTQEECGTKLMVRNIPFEANAREVEDIFKTFGSLKSVRLPKKVAGTGSHRGFAFIEYISKEEAKKAFESLCHSTHLYGRRLVLEWAEQDGTIDDLRKKTASQYADGQPVAKRLKKSELIESVVLSKS